MTENSCTIFTDYQNITKTDINDLVVYHFGSERCNPGHSWSGVRDHYLIHYVISGKGVFVCNGKTYSLKGKQGFLICPDMLSYYQADVDEPWEYCWIGFNGRRAKSYLEELKLSNANPIFTCTPKSSPEKVIYKLIDAQNIHVGRDFLITGLLYQFFAELANTIDLPESATENQDLKRYYVQKAIDYIRKNYSRKISIEEIAKYIGLDRKYMCALFQKILHTSPQEFLLKFRLDKACVLLCQDSLFIQDIAHSVGYDDPLLFSKMFKKKKGLSPTQYRKRLMGKKLASKD